MLTVSAFMLLSLSSAKKFDIPAPHINELSMEFNNLRLNLCRSNTEALARLNAESRSDKILTQQKADDIPALLPQTE